MKVQRVYIDTSVIGGCHDDEFSTWSNGLMKDFRLGNFRPIISRIVTLEIADSPDVVKKTYAELLDMDHELLEITAEATGLSDLYQERGILTPKFYEDALHSGLATIAEVDVLVSWKEQGYKSLQIYSPREVTNYGEDKEF